MRRQVKTASRMIGLGCTAGSFSNSANSYGGLDTCEDHGQREWLYERYLASALVC